jgi:2-amino-4-hydroxy-6-hydroxymethyldihydropteridine diphosphokinase
VRAYLGLGSNVGDRLGSLRAAIRALAPHGVRVVARSSVYETAPQGQVLDQPDFLNACVEVETELDAEGLLDACKAVERELGRTAAGMRHAPRPIDVDVLLMDGHEQASERLTVPHPDLTARRFVVEPLLELDPALALPDGTPLARALDSLSDQRVQRVGPL